MRRTRILVADPLRIFRAGVRNLLARESGFEIVEAARSRPSLHGEIRAKSLRDVASAAFSGSTPRATSVRTRRVELMLSSRDDALLFASPLTTLRSRGSWRHVA